MAMIDYMFVALFWIMNVIAFGTAVITSYNLFFIESITNTQVWAALYFMFTLLIAVYKATILKPRYGEQK